eukprot:m.62730 g.62730  ORF g.62730 m.62730 type:complete len:231 (+) comp35101_c0_seq14:2960-3652(+)
MLFRFSFRSSFLGLLICLLPGKAPVMSAADPVEQRCSAGYFYCHYTTIPCHSASDRCQIPQKDGCWGSSPEPDCEYQTSTAQWKYCRGWSWLISSSSSLGRRRRSDLKIRHEYISYRGFTYEFGKNYVTQILDVADPKYKYKDSQTRCGVSQGYSKCSRADIQDFIDGFNKNYNLLTNNCQTFARLLEATLKSSSCKPTYECNLAKREAASVAVNVVGLLMVIFCSAVAT